MKKISIGIMAYNEEDSIADTIKSVFEQDIFHLHTISQCDKYKIELVIVPNGCHDRTPAVAQKSIDEQLTKPSINPNLTAHVCELEEPGKENAWNYFVHEFSSIESDFLILMDADVRLEHPKVLRELVECLVSHPHANIAGGSPVKHIEAKSNKSFFDHLSIGASSLRKGMKGIVAGCLYCGRAETLRGFRLPPVLMGEDAFIRAMIVTEGFTAPDDPNLIVKSENARVIFEAYTKPSDIIRNKTRRMLELSINAIIYTKLWAESSPDVPAGELIKKWHTQDPQWSHKLVELEFSKRGFWKVPKFHIYSQFLQLKYHGKLKRVLLLPVASATLILNTIAVYRANKIAAKGDIRHLWNKSSSESTK